MGIVVFRIFIIGHSLFQSAAWEFDAVAVSRISVLPDQEKFPVNGYRDHH